MAYMKDSTGRRLDTFEVAAKSELSPAIGGLFAAMGDSITEHDADQAQNVVGNGWPTYMAIASGGAIRLVRNSGEGGEKSSQMLARFATDVLAHNPSTVAIASGTNDVDAVLNSLPDIEGMIKLAQNSGKGVILANIPPRGVSAANIPAAPTLTTSTASGTLPAGTYGYVITMETGQGQSLPSVEATATLSGAGTITLNWDRPATNDYRYRIYRRNPGGSLGFVQGVGSGFANPNYPRWVDTGAVVTPTTVPPSVDSAGTANYSGQVPVTGPHANMIKTQKVIKKLASKYDVPLIDQYALLTDPATGRYKQGYSPDGIHPTEKVQRLMGENAWAQVSKHFPAYTPFLCTDPFDYSGLLPKRIPNGAPSDIAGALLPHNVSLGAGQIPHSWGGSGTSNFTTNLGPETGIAGNVFTVSTSDYVGRNYNMGWSGVTPGNTIRIAFRFKATGLDLNNGTVHLSLQRLGTGGANYLTALNLKSDVSGWSIWTAEGVVPVGATGYQFNFNVTGRGVSASIAQVTIDDLTAQGLV